MGQADSKGINLVNLSDSNPTRWGLGFSGLPVYCADPRGPQTARQVLAEFLSARDGREVDPNRLYLLSSTSQGYAWLFKLLCDPGQAVYSPIPGYPLVEALARLESVTVLPYRLLRTGTGWEPIMPRRPNSNQVNSSLPQEQAKALVAINPNNPTGSYVHGWEQTQLFDYCRAHDLALIADEVFYDYPLCPPADRARLAGTTQCLTFALDGLSKSLCAPGAKVAWLEVSGPVDLVDEAQRRLDVIADAYLPFADTLAVTLPEYLKGIPARTQATQARCTSNLATLKNLVSTDPNSPVSILEPEGGWSTLLQFPAHIDEDNLVTTLINEHGITAQPGYFFDMPNPGYINLSLLLEPEVFALATAKLLSQISELS